MAKKKGAKYECQECGLVVVVDDPCGCAACELICCEVPMKEVKPKAKKQIARTSFTASKCEFMSEGPSILVHNTWDRMLE